MKDKTLIKTFNCETELNNFLQERKRITFQSTTRKDSLIRVLIDVKVSSDEYGNQTFLLIYKTNEDYIVQLNNPQ